MIEQLIDNLEKNVYDEVQHISEEDIWASAYKEAQKQIEALSIEQRKALEKDYRIPDLCDSIAGSCVKIKKESRWTIDDEADFRFHYQREG